MTTSTPRTISEQLLGHEAFVRRLALCLVNDTGAAEDVAQDAMVLALERRPQHPGGLRGWLTGTVRRLARHRRRSESRRRWREAAAARPEALPVQEPLEEEHRVVRLVLALDEPFRETLLLTHYHGLRPAEIARHQGVPAATVRSRLHRAHGKLRGALRAEHGGDGRAWVLALAPFTGADPVGASRSAGSLATNAFGGWRLGAPAVAALAGGVLAVGGLSLWLGSDATTRGLSASGVEPSSATAAPAGSDARSTLATLERERRPEPLRAPLHLEPPAVANPDHPYWEAVREARAAGERFELDRVESATDHRLRHAVESATLPALALPAEKSLTVIVNKLATITGVPASTTRAAESAAIDAGAVYDLDLRRPHSLASVLDLLVFLTRDEIAWTIARGEVYVCSRPELVDRFVGFEHDVADFLPDPREYFGPEEPLHPIFESPPEVIELASLVVDLAYSGGWDARALKDTYETGFVVRHLPEVQRDVQRLLDGLRRFYLPLPEEGVPGRRLRLGSTPEGDRIVRFLVETTTAEVAASREGERALAALLRPAADAGRFDLVFADGASAAARVVPSERVSLAQELQALRAEDERWTVFREFVVLWKGHSLSADRTLLMRDIRPLFAVEAIGEEHLTGHPVLARWVAAGEGPLHLDPDCLDQLIRNHVDPESWDDDPTNSLRIDGRGILQLCQSPAAVAEIEGTLDRLEEVVRESPR